MNKPSSKGPQALSELLRTTLNESFARQGFASTELVTRWIDIVGEEIATHSQPLKIQWPRAVADQQPAPATLILRVEGPAALDIQHSSSIILERVNRFFGWHAIGKIALRQAPLKRRQPKVRRAGPDPQETERIAATLPPSVDNDLRHALARLGAAIKGK